MDINLPPQRKSYKQKTKTWREDCVNKLDTATSMYHNSTTRRRITEKIINQELYEGKLNIPDMMQIINPYNTVADTIPSNIPHHPIVVPKIDLLVGEESKSAFDWSVVVGDSDSISKKAESRKQLVNKKIEELLDKDADEEQIKKELKDFAIYLKYEWKDIREVRATKLLKHYYRALEFPVKFTEGFKDFLIHAEAIFQCSIQDAEPVFEKLNPIKVHTIRGGMSSRIEDADIIIIEDHWSPGRVLDTYYDKLSRAEIDRISKGYLANNGAFDNQDYANSFIIPESGDITESYVNLMQAGGNNFSKNFVDDDGNIRILRCYWSSLKKAFRVKYFDEYGDTQFRIEAEEYIPDPSKGESTETIWIREWWHGCKIGSDIYPVIEPMPIQYNRMSNPSKSHPGIVGEINNTNQGKSTSVMDRMKSYQYLYDINWDRLNKALAKNLGTIMEMDLAKIPAGWDVSKWLNYAVKFGIGFIDSFKEGNAGASQGKLAGNFNTTGKVLDVNQGNYIQQTLNLLEYIKAEMSEIIGISPQRQGAISSSETVGGVERSVMQSSNTTAWLFKKYEGLKLRCLSVFLETCKVALKGNSKKLQYILDDFTTELFNIDGDEFSEQDYDIFITSDMKTKEKEQLLDQAAHAFMQNNGKLSTVMDIMFSDSITEKMRKIELAEQEQQEIEQANQQQASEMQKQQIQANAEKEQQDRDLKKYEIDTSNATKLMLERIKQQGDSEGLEHASSENTEDRLLKIKELQAEIEMNREKIRAQTLKKSPE